MRKREANVDLIRIVACLAVIAVHIKMPVMSAQGFDRSRLFIFSLCCDSVGAFFMAAGFYMFKHDDTKKLFGGVFLRLILPAFAMTLFTGVFSRWIAGEASFVYCLGNIGFDLGLLLKSVISWSPLGYYDGQMWYLASYVQALLWFPLLKLICVESERETKVRRYLLALALFGMLINDIQAVWPFAAGKIFTYSVLPNNLVLILLGYEIYRVKDKILGNIKLRYISLATFAACNVIRWAAACKLMGADITNEYFMSWYPVVSIVCMAAMICYFLTFAIKNEHMAKAVSFTGERTFAIYLVHVSVYCKLASLGVKDKFAALFGGEYMSFAGELAYTLVYSVFVFLICLVLAVALKYIKKGFLMLTDGFRKKNSCGC